jgi:hypothetical protein
VTGRRRVLLVLTAGIVYAGLGEAALPRRRPALAPAAPARPAVIRPAPTGPAALARAVSVAVADRDPRWRAGVSPAVAAQLGDGPSARPLRGAAVAWAQTVTLTATTDRVLVLVTAIAASDPPRTVAVGFDWTATRTPAGWQLTGLNP